MYLFNTSIYDPLLVFFTDTYCMYVCMYVSSTCLYFCVFFIYIPYRTPPKRAGIFIRCNTDMAKA